VQDGLSNWHGCRTADDHTSEERERESGEAGWATLEEWPTKQVRLFFLFSKFSFSNQISNSINSKSSQTIEIVLQYAVHRQVILYFLLFFVSFI
jgi:hypothetical protein